MSDENRWNARGEPTLYLSQDRDVALAEYARHLRIDRSQDERVTIVRRRVFSLELVLDRVVDLRNEEVLAALSIRDAPGCFLDRDFALATATFIRRTTAAQALVVPSFAFLGDLNHWILAVFLEKVPGGPAAFVEAVSEEGVFEVALDA